MAGQMIITHVVELACIRGMRANQVVVAQKSAYSSEPMEGGMTKAVEAHQGLVDVAPPHVITKEQYVQIHSNVFHVTKHKIAVLESTERPVQQDPR